MQSYIQRKRAIFDRNYQKKKNIIMKKVDFEKSCASFNLCLSVLPVLCVRSLQVLWGNWLHNQTFPKLVAAAQYGVKRGRRRGCGRRNWMQRYFFILIVKSAAILYSFSLLIMSLQKKKKKRHSATALKINTVHYNSSCLPNDLRAPLHTHTRMCATHERRTN